MNFEVVAAGGALVICPECCGLRGPLGAQSDIVGSDDGAQPSEFGHRFHQCCRCEDRSQEVRWTGFDFNSQVELCRCCGAQAIESGSRWSSFYCDVCREQVLRLNRSVGQWVIPIGRHSVMHGLLVRGDESFDHEIAERFGRAMRGLFEGINHLDAWARIVVRENLNELGFAPGQEVPLTEYLEASRGRIDRARAFERLCDHFASRDAPSDGDPV